MNNIPVKRLASAALAVVMAASALTALSSCGKKEPVKEKRTNVYSGIDTVLPEGVEYMQNLFGSGSNVGMMYSKVYTVTYNELGDYLALLDTATGEVSEIPIVLENDGTGMSNSYIHSMKCAPDGTVWALVTKWEYSEDYSESKNTYTLYPIDSVTGDMGEGILLNTALVNAGMDEANMYISGYAFMEDGTIYINAETSVIGISSDGTFREKIELDESGWMNGMYPADGKLYLLFYPDNGSQKIKIVENGKITDFATDTLTGILSTSYNFYGFTDNLMYYGTTSGVAAYDFTTDTSSELMNFINSDVESTNTNNIVSLPD